MAKLNHRMVKHAEFIFEINTPLEKAVDCTANQSFFFFLERRQDRCFHKLYFNFSTRTYLALYDLSLYSAERCPEQANSYRRCYGWYKEHRISCCT